MVDGISIIICCHNSVSRIEETLKHAFALTRSGFFYEIILVDNNSNDGTAIAARNTHDNYNKNGISFKIVEEPNPGLASARKKGIEESKYELVLFCDDDNHLEENYLIGGRKIFEHNPLVGIAGGWCKPKLVHNPGSWVEDFYGALAIEKNPKRDGIVNWVFGAGMMLKKSIFAELKNRQIDFLLTDREGKKLTSGGDTEMCLLTKFIGFDVYYSSSLQLNHCIVANRLTKKYFFVTAHQNFYPVIYLFLLERIVLKTKLSSLRMYIQLFFERAGRIFYFLPRCIVGRHQFYSFISVYGNVLFIGWMFLHTLNFFRVASAIKTNLSHE